MMENDIQKSLEAIDKLPVGELRMAYKIQFQSFIDTISGLQKLNSQLQEDYNNLLIRHNKLVNRVKCHNDKIVAFSTIGLE